jgi:hypothetical protein
MHLSSYVKRVTWLLTGFGPYAEKSPGEAGLVYDSDSTTLSETTRFHSEEGAGDFDGSITSKNDVSNDEITNAVKRAFEQQDAFQQPNAATEIDDDLNALITFFETANESTPIHEMIHPVFAMRDKMSTMEGIEQWIKDDHLATLNEFGVTQDQFRDGTLLREVDPALLDDTARMFLEQDPYISVNEYAHERFSKGFEVYMATGQAPSSTLKKIFERFRKWLLEIYGDAQKTLGIELSDTMKDIYARMLATPEEIDKTYRQSTTFGEMALEDSLSQQEIERVEAEERAAAATSSAWGEYDQEWDFDAMENLDPQAEEAVDGYFGMLEEERNREEAQRQLKSVFKMIRDEGGLRMEDIVHQVGEDLAVDLRKKHRGLIRKDAKIALDVMAEHLGMDERTLIMLLETADMEKHKPIAPMIAVNTATLNSGGKNHQVKTSTRRRLMTHFKKLGGIKLPMGLFFLNRPLYEWLVYMILQVYNDVNIDTAKG